MLHNTLLLISLENTHAQTKLLPDIERTMFQPNI